MGTWGEKYKDYLKAVVAGAEGEQVGQVQGVYVEKGPESVKDECLWGRLEKALLGEVLDLVKGLEDHHKGSAQF